MSPRLFYPYSEPNSTWNVRIGFMVYGFATHQGAEKFATIYNCLETIQMI